MRGARLAFRGLRLSAVTLAHYLALRIGFALAWLGPRSVVRRRAWRRRVMRSWAGAVCRALAVRVQVVGEPPREPCFLVCNHLGYLDIPVLASVVDTVFVSKHDVVDWPVVGHLATSAHTIYVERARKRALPDVNLRIRETLAAGDGVVVFPEGTSSGGTGVLPFRPPLLASAAQLGLPVHYASLTYAAGCADPPASQAVCWWGDMPFAPHVRGLLQLSGVRARLAFGPHAVVETDRKELARKLWQGVSLAMTPLA